MTKRRINFFIFDGLNRFVDCFSVVIGDHLNKKANEEKENEISEIASSYDMTLHIDGHTLSVFRDILTSSVNCRKLVKNLLNRLKDIPADRDINICLQLVFPKAEAVDFAWNYRINRLVLERSELEYSMSWLSTLGGAFSALGDSSEHCAKVAGKISAQQLQIALKLGDPPLVARCKLYMALSLLQQKQLKLARKLIEEQYELAKNFQDFKLMNMCKGVWAKLQYTHRLLKEK